MQLVEAQPDVLGAAQLAAVGVQQQPAALGDPERGGELAGGAAPLVVGQAEPDDAASGVLDGEPGQRAGVERVARAVRRDHHRDAEAGRLGRLAHRVEHQVGEGGDTAEAGAVAAGVHLDLQPAAAVADVVLRGLAHQPAHVALGAQHGPGDVVQPLEAEPALLVGGRQLRRPLVNELVGQHDAVAVGELEQGGVPHRPREVQVEVRLGECVEITGGERSELLQRWLRRLFCNRLETHPQAKSFCSRVTPSTRSSSPSA